MKNLTFLFVSLAALLLAGCQSLDISDERPNNVQYIEKTDAAWQTHLQKIKAIKAYSASGQLGYISAKERFSSRFDWQYNNPRAYTLFLSSTISSSTLKFQMHANGMTISDNKGNQRSEADAKMLLREIVGMDIPLEQFATWLKGEPNERADYKVGANHLLAGFGYPIDGTLWTADYLNYHTDQSVALPKDILLKNAEQTLKIRVDSWKY
ncbi:lipoprotein insertase outer membrane protein LolB [Caviibacterium pharyngocola]|uniref:Outer-membrane lipoprotein LolB n=1 Tax=Caviibacterium pharyngocola TaxID=28159 RepID=A0A2M8RWQ2_9PAST|nr:lipoprotein insertase outer membrane protein LolB [Caviibacterium pharyngocola]PJG83320.1 lipoprotein localization factor LolB [Caviibacterium pharyngocola]